MCPTTGASVISGVVVIAILILLILVQMLVLMEVAPVDFSAQDKDNLQLPLPNSH